MGIIAKLKIKYGAGDIFFLPNREEVNAIYERSADVEQKAWEYFRDVPLHYQSKKRTFRDPDGNPVSWWLRSQDGEGDYDHATFCLISASGTLTYANHKSRYSAVLACTIS